MTRLTTNSPVSDTFVTPVIWDSRIERGLKAKRVVDADGNAQTVTEPFEYTTEQREANRLKTVQAQQTKLDRYFRAALRRGKQGTARGRDKTDQFTTNVTILPDGTKQKNRAPIAPIDNAANVIALMASRPSAEQRMVMNAHDDIAKQGYHIQRTISENSCVERGAMANELGKRVVSLLADDTKEYRYKKASSTLHIADGKTVKKEYRRHADELIDELSQEAILYYYQRRQTIDLSGACRIVLKRHFTGIKRQGELTDKEKGICFTLLRGQEARHNGVNAKDIAFWLNRHEWINGKWEVISLLSQGYSQSDVSRELGIDKMQISRIVKGIRTLLPVDYFERETSTIPHKPSAPIIPINNLQTARVYSPALPYVPSANNVKHADDADTSLVWHIMLSPDMGTDKPILSFA